MTVMHGFELIKETTIPELSTKARLFRHVRTGAELLSLENDDENKSFAVGFPTPPSDSTGLPHILEHSVLNGSRKYPVKEPFVELLKTSLNTFLNAMTFPDMTVYPIASTNLKDFYNLVDVYLDAVFYPRISPKILQQEGWHHEYDAAAEDEALTYKGVVFNEMKGYYSSPDIVLEQMTRAALLPDTPYAHDAGGDPAVIPDLTYQQFKNFHETYYHPSNARIFFYGDDAPEERLRLIDAFLVEFGRRDVDATLPLQPRFSQPRKVMKTFDAGEADSDENKSMVTMSWLLPEVTDTEKMLELEILSHILVETPASPLRQVLIESGIGEDLVGEGMDTYKREASFTVGLKGIQLTDADKVETLILETLGQLAEEGVDKATVEASLNTVEFILREKNTGQFPRGLATFINVLPVWLHGGDPMQQMLFEASLSRIKQRFMEEPQYVENLIGQYFLNNSHRSTVIMQPDPQVKIDRDNAEKARLAAEKAKMTDADLQTVLADMDELERMQTTPDSPEALATIPTLTIDDIERNIKITPIEVTEEQGATIVYHDLATSGVAYVDFGFNLYALPGDYLPYVDLFAKSLLEIGTKSMDYVQLSQWIGAKTGGIRPEMFTAVKQGRDASAAHLFMRARSMLNQTGDMLKIFAEMLLNVKLDNQDRFKQMVLEEKAGQEAYLGLIGHVIGNNRVRAHFDDAGWASEQMSGITNLFFLRDLVQKIDSDWQSVLSILEDIRRRLVNTQAIVVNVTLDADGWSQFRPQLQDFLKTLPNQPVEWQTWQRGSFPAYEAFTVPTQVNFVVKGANLYDLGYTHHGSQVVILKHMNFDYIWTKIRVQGGAYGGRCILDNLSGVATYLSWQDPNNLKTLENYDGSAAYLRALDLNASDLEKAIIGAIGQIDKYLLPDAKGFASTQRYLIGYTDAMRQQLRDEVLNTTLADFHAFGDILAKVAATGHIVITSSPNNIEAVNQSIATPLTVTKVM
jgi:hypothetical protein